MRSKHLFFITLFLLFATLDKAQIIDRAPVDKINYLPIEGGSIKIVIDTITPLTTLINTLEKPWEFEETGKGYWIGYTNIMYSIAAHNNEAVKQLVNFIDTAKNEHAKYGAVYTLHLIGINRTIIGRFSEEFKNTEARTALIYLLKYNDLREEILTLLIRDPWISDVPKLLATMAVDSDDGYIAAALLHYKIKDLPLNNTVPEAIGNLKFNFPRPVSSNLNKEYCNAQLQKALHLIDNLKSPSIAVEKKLFGTDLWGNVYYDINGNYAVKNNGSITIYSFLNDIEPLNTYTCLGNKIFYYVDQGRLNICGADVAKNRLLQWWNKQTDADKKLYMHDAALPN